MKNGNMQAAIDNGQTLAAYIDQLLNGGERTVGFALLFFPLGAIDGTNVNYVSNCERRDMIAALKEVLARWEGQLHQRGTA